MGLHFTACAPKKYQPDAALVAECQKIAAETGATLTFEEDPAKAAKGADVLYTDVWVSMGEPVEVWAERINDLAAYQINQQLMDIADTGNIMPPKTTWFEPKLRSGLVIHKLD